MSKLRAQAESGAGPRVLFMGLPGQFSRIPLARLLDEGIGVRAVIVPASETAAPVQRLVPEPSPSELPLLTPFVEADITHLAWQHGIPVLGVGRLAEPATLSALAAYQPDVICVACFNQKFPPALLTLPRFGCLNLHPSPLPAYRGPHPLFWAFRNGEQRWGVTVHLMDEGLDTGDILCQAPIAIPDGMRGDVLEARCASVGAGLLVEALRALWAGTARPTPQAEEQASYHPWPAPADFRVSPEWPARRAFNFIRGVAHLSGPLAFEVAGRRFPVREAVSYTPDGTLDAPFVHAGEDLWVQCTPGTIHVKLSRL